MKLKELTETFMVTANLKKKLPGLHGLYTKVFQRSKG